MAARAQGGRTRHVKISDWQAKRSGGSGLLGYEPSQMFLRFVVLSLDLYLESIPSASGK